MYRITLCVNGLYHCMIRYQDGNHQWYVKDIKTAIKEMKQSASAYNHDDKLKTSEISFFREEKKLVEQVTDIPCKLSELKR